MKGQCLQKNSGKAKAGLKAIGKAAKNINRGRKNHQSDTGEEDLSDETRHMRSSLRLDHSPVKKNNTKNKSESRNNGESRSCNNSVNSKSSQHAQSDDDNTSSDEDETDSKLTIPNHYYNATPVADDVESTDSQSSIKGNRKSLESHRGNPHLNVSNGMIFIDDLAQYSPEKGTKKRKQQPQVRYHSTHHRSSNDSDSQDRSLS